LNNIAFNWNAREDGWEKKFQSLVEYKNSNGDCLVPKSTPRLGRWVSNQRQMHKKYHSDIQGGKIPKNKVMLENRFRRLDQIGFCWDAVNTLPKAAFSPSSVRTSLTTAFVDQAKKFTIGLRARDHLISSAWQQRLAVVRKVANSDRGNSSSTLHDFHAINIC